MNSNTRDTSNQIIYFHYLRVFSIFSMILLHVSANRWLIVDISSSEWNVLNFYDSLVRFCVPVFIMISGAIFLDTSRTITIKEIIKVRIKKLLFAFYFWSFTYAITTRLSTYKTINSSVLNEIFITTLKGHYHLWFIPMLVGLYLLIPFFRKITNDRKLTEFFLILSFIFVFCFNLIKVVPFLNYYLTIIINLLQFNFVLGYSSYFILGFYLNKYSINNILIYILGVLSLLFTIFATCFISLKNGVANPFFYDYLLPNTLFISSMVFILFKFKFQNGLKNNIINNIVLTLSKHSFGIYLIHDFFIIILSKLGINSSINPILAVPFITLLIFILSYFSIWLLSKIKFLNKVIL